MEQNMSLVRVEGNIIPLDQDDSSDDEFDVDIPERDVDMPIDASSHSDDEELEVFPKGSAPPAVVDKGSKAVGPLKPEPDETSKPSLLAAMTAAVSAVERGEVAFTADPVALAKSAPSLPNPVSDDSANKDVFGIAYKPFKKRDLGYELPKGPVFEDELEFERDLQEMSSGQGSKRESQPVADDDDEFDVTSETTDSAESIAKAIERVAQLAREEASRVPSSSVDSENTLPLSFSSPSATISESSAAVEKRFDVRQAAKEAFGEISHIYGSGLGDLEVRLLDSDNGSKSSSSTTRSEALPTASLRLNVHDTIEEGDEEEEEEEEAREVSLRAAEVSLEQVLAAEWEALVEDASVAGTAPAPGNVDDVEAIITVSYDEALQQLRASDLTRFSDLVTVKTYDEEEGWMAAMSRPVDLTFPQSEQLLTWPFLLAQLNYDATVPLHRNMLQTIYFALVPGDRRCPVLGLHWDKLGFQGLDPCTDLNRSMKMLAVLQMLHLVSSQPSLAASLHALSRHCDSFDPSTISAGRKAAVERSREGARAAGAGTGVDLTWPFMCVSVMFTKETIQALRCGSLNKKCNKRKDVLSVLNDLHHGLFLDFASRLVDNPSKHHAQHLSELTKEVQRQPSALLNAYKKSRLAGFPQAFAYRNTPVSGGSGSGSSSGSFSVFGGSGAAAGAGAGAAEAPQKFDTLEEIEKQQGARESDSKKPGFWSGLLGGKANKFKA